MNLNVNENFSFCLSIKIENQCISNDIENLSLIADLELKYFIRKHNGIQFNIEYQ
jgi:hypothetical protein